MEICGRYALVKDHSRGFSSRDYQLASLDAIRSFMQLMQGEPNVPAFEKLIGHIDEGSRSPMETRAFLLMCLPKRYGGYGLPKPSLNMRVPLTQHEQTLARRRYFECDLCWPEERLIIEYDGHADHAERSDRDRDSVKRNVLISKGYTVLTITGGQIRDKRMFDKITRETAKLLRYRLRAFPKDWEEKRAELRRELFASMTRYERDRFDSERSLHGYEYPFE